MLTIVNLGRVESLIIESDLIKPYAQQPMTAVRRRWYARK